ncbi:LOW QUALITY PROTEIN: protein SPMIP2 [Pelecanus crispus]|uniref:LOW QUALITY PROTEIN: protein SPMIP2 n=1 Tax=Pelecanus crispus TaxID=36300 RepID=UPI003F5CFDCD
MWASLGASSPRTPAGAASPGLPPCQRGDQARPTPGTLGVGDDMSQCISPWCLAGREEPAAIVVVGRGAQMQQGLDPSQAGRARTMPSSPCRASAGEALMEARAIFSGPDAICDYRTRKPEHTHNIEATSPAIEGTHNPNSLWCLAPPSSYISPRRPHYPGKIGWSVRELSHFTRKHLQSGAHIKTGPTRQAAEDKATHWYQSHWQPTPYILEQGHHARDRLACDSGSYHGCLHPRSKQAAMIRASQAPLLPKSKDKLLVLRAPRQPSQPYHLRSPISSIALMLALTGAKFNVNPADNHQQLVFCKHAAPGDE